MVWYFCVCFASLLIKLADQGAGGRKGNDSMAVQKARPRGRESRSPPIEQIGTGPRPPQVLISGGRRRSVNGSSIEDDDLPIAWSSGRPPAMDDTWLHVPREHVAVAVAGPWHSSIGGDESFSFPCRRSPPLGGGLETSTYQREARSGLETCTI